MRQGILGPSGFSAQTSFNDLLEASINKNDDADIVVRYQNALQNARSQVDYVL